MCVCVCLNDISVGFIFPCLLLLPILLVFVVFFYLVIIKALLGGAFVVPQESTRSVCLPGNSAALPLFFCISFFFFSHFLSLENDLFALRFCGLTANRSKRSAALFSQHVAKAH